MPHFRPVRDDDLPLICAYPQTADELYFIYPKARFPLTVDQLQAAIAARTEATVAEVDGVPLAFANFYEWRDGHCALGNLIVAPHARQQGIGSALVHHMCAIAADKYAAREVHVSCFNHNTGGLLLYPRLGFSPYAVEARSDHSGGQVALIHFRRQAA